MPSRKTAVLGWIAFVLIAFAVGNIAVGTKSAGNNTGPGEAGRADRILSNAFPDHAQEAVLISSRSGSARDPGFRGAVDDVVQGMQRRPEVVKVSSPYAPASRRPFPARRSQRPSQSRAAPSRRRPVSAQSRT